MQPLFISRDGVINVAIEGGVTHRTQLEFIPGSLDTIAALSRKGFSIIMLTHQPGLSRGLFDLDELEAIHAKIVDGIENRGGEVTAIFYCPHDESDGCYCIPPKTGLLDVVQMELDCDIDGAYYFCDENNLAEIQMAQQKNCQVIHCNEENTLAKLVPALK